MNNIVVTTGFDHDIWVEVHFGFVALSEGEELPRLAQLAGLE